MKRCLALLVALPWLAWGSPSTNFDGTNDAFYVDVDVTSSTEPVSFFIWANHDDTNGLFQIGVQDKSDASQYVVCNGNSGSLDAYHRRGGGVDNIPVTNAYTLQQWTSHACVSLASNDHYVVSDGDWASRGTGSGTNQPTTEDRTNIGCRCVETTTGCDSSCALDYFGELAYGVIWGGTGAGLVQGEIEELNLGMWPEWINPQLIVGFWPLLNASGVDFSSGDNDMSVHGSVTGATHGPPMYFPIGGQ